MWFSFYNLYVQLLLHSLYLYFAFIHLCTMHTRVTRSPISSALQSRQLCDCYFGFYSNVLLALLLLLCIRSKWRLCRTTLTISILINSRIQLAFISFELFHVYFQFFVSHSLLHQHRHFAWVFLLHFISIIVREFLWCEESKEKKHCVDAGDSDSDSDRQKIKEGRTKCVMRTKR